MAVPTATRTAAVTCSHGATRCHPKSVTPRNVASKKRGQNFVADQGSDYIASDLGEPGPVRAELVGERNPETTPIANETAKIFVQKRARRWKLIQAGALPQDQQGRCGTAIGARPLELLLGRAVAPS
jgi:hypothetical protein